MDLMDYKLMQRQIWINELCPSFFMLSSLSDALTWSTAKPGKCVRHGLQAIGFNISPKARDFQAFSPLIYFLTVYEVVYIVWNLNLFSPYTSSEHSSPLSHDSVPITITIVLCNKWTLHRSSICTSVWFQIWQRSNSCATFYSEVIWAM